MNKLKRCTPLTRASSLSLVDIYLGRGVTFGNPKLNVKDTLKRTSYYRTRSLADNVNALNSILQSRPLLESMRASVLALELNSIGSARAGPSGSSTPPGSPPSSPSRPSGSSPDTPRNPMVVACELSSLLTVNSIDYAVGGSIAFGAWAVPRYTEDLEVNVFMSADDHPSVVKLLDVLESAGAEFMDNHKGRHSITKSEAITVLQRNNQIFLKMSGCHVDIFLDSTILETYAKQRKQLLDNMDMFFLDAETIAAYKLVWQRNKDIIDLEALFAVRGDKLDLAHIKSVLLEVGFDELGDPIQILEKLEVDYIKKSD